MRSIANLKPTKPCRAGPIPIVDINNVCTACTLAGKFLLEKRG
uniref:Uncharacterized protein n=1 Tax=Rhizophora mucronata TaxID=61149 RepID=A0A2P2KJD6_RHIMU